VGAGGAGLPVKPIAEAVAWADVVTALAPDQRTPRDRFTAAPLSQVAGLGVTGGLGYLVYRGVEAKNGTKDNKSSSKFPAPSEGLATAKANQSGIPKQVLSDASWTYGEGPALDTVAASAPVLDIYFDYSCSHCAQFEGLHTQEINQLLSEKKITLALHPCKLLEQEWTSVVMNAMRGVFDEAAWDTVLRSVAVDGLSGQSRWPTKAAPGSETPAASTTG